MELIEAQVIANGLMNQHGLTESGWTFKFDRAVKRLGACRHDQKTISLSQFMVGAADRAVVEQTLLHEIAHALVGTKDHFGNRTGHGPVWKRKATSIGYKGSRCAKNPYQTKLSGGEPYVSDQSTPNPVHDSSSAPVLRVGSPVVLGSGIKGTIVTIGRSRYHVRAEDGRTWTSPFANVHPLESGAITTPLPPVMLKVGERGTLNVGGGKYAGMSGRVLKIGRSRYVFRLESSDDNLSVPFHIVLPV